MQNISTAVFSHIHMKLFLIIASVFILLVLYLVIRRNRREADDSGISIKGTPNFDDMVLCVAESCRNVICPALDSLADADVINACKNHRTGSDSLSTLEYKVRRRYSANSDDDSRYIYINYMIESAEKIAETTRHMVIRPSFKIPIADKCEIQALRKMMADMLEPDYDSQMVCGNKDFVEHLIAIRCKSMKYEDFNDGAQAYSYLTLLYYLQSFINSFHHIIPTSSHTLRQ